jgi:hypothetical protein
MRATHPGRVVVLLLATIALFSGIAHASTGSASLSGRVLVALNRTEPDVAIDPKDPSMVAVGTNPNYDVVVSGVQPDGAFVSHSAGSDFHQSFLPAPSGFTEYADPSAAFAGSGTVFFGYLAETPSYCSAAGRSAVLVSASTDSGGSFRSPAVVSVSAANDKPFVGVESIPHGHAHVFITWTQFFGNSSRVEVARSTDGGFTFGAPHALFTSQDDNSGSLPLIGPHHRIYVMWASAADRGLLVTNPAKILFRVSTDDGKTYGPLRRAGPNFTSIPRMANPDSMRNLTLPAAAVAPDGDVYVAWSQVSHDYGRGTVSADIVMTRSTNGGRSWAAPHRLNDSRAHDRFMPALTAFSDGSVGAVYYDRREGGGDLGVYGTRVAWGASVRVAPNVRLNPHPSPVYGIHYIPPGSTCLSPGRFFGDYISVAASGANSMLACWADTTGGAPGQTNIWLRRVTIPSP